MDKNHDQSMYHLQETHIRYKDARGLNIKNGGKSIP